MNYFLSLAIYLTFFWKLMLSSKGTIANVIGFLLAASGELIFGNKENFVKVLKLEVKFNRIIPFDYNFMMAWGYLFSIGIGIGAHLFLILLF